MHLLIMKTKHNAYILGKDQRVNTNWAYLNLQLGKLYQLCNPTFFIIITQRNTKVPELGVFYPTLLDKTPNFCMLGWRNERTKLSDFRFSKWEDFDLVLDDLQPSSGSSFSTTTRDQTHQANHRVSIKINSQTVRNSDSYDDAIWYGGARESPDGQC